MTLNSMSIHLDRMKTVDHSHFDPRSGVIFSENLYRITMKPVHRIQA